MRGVRKWEKAPGRSQPLRKTPQRGETRRLRGRRATSGINLKQFTQQKCSQWVCAVLQVPDRQTAGGSGPGRVSGTGSMEVGEQERCCSLCLPQPDPTGSPSRNETSPQPPPVCSRDHPVPPQPAGWTDGRTAGRSRRRWSKEQARPLPAPLGLQGRKLVRLAGELLIK